MSWQLTSGTDMWLYIRDCWEILSSHRSLLELERPPPTNSKYAIPDTQIGCEEQWNRTYACACIVLQCDWPQCFLLSLAVEIDDISINQLGVSMRCNPFSTLSTVILLLSIEEQFPNYSGCSVDTINLKFYREHKDLWWRLWFSRFSMISLRLLWIVCIKIFLSLCSWNLWKHYMAVMCYWKISQCLEWLHS